MSKIFNTTANCIPSKHYMVDLTSRLAQIREMVDRGDYFTINRARQYGKTTTLMALAEYLKDDYLVISLDFQDLDESDWQSVPDFVSSFAQEIYYVIRTVEGLPEEVVDSIREFADGEAKKMNLKSLFVALGECCVQSPKPIVLMIDEVDAASEYDVFLNFLAQLRARYIKREMLPTFQSVILAGLHDIKNLKRKFVAPGEHSTNSPWNVAADYLIDMSFSVDDIAGMLMEYEHDYATGMDVQEIAQIIYDYTSGYPFLVSRICKLLDERVQGTEEYPNRTAAWTKGGVVKAVGMILMEKNTLFDSLMDKVEKYPDLKEMLYVILMKGADIYYYSYTESVMTAKTYEIIKEENSKTVISNRIFETLLFNYFAKSGESKESEVYNGKGI